MFFSATSQRHTPTFRWEKRGVFAFSDFAAWNATVGVDGEWRKLVYRQTPSTPNENLVKIEITKRVYLGFCSKN